MTWFLYDQVGALATTRGLELIDVVKKVSKKPVTASAGVMPTKLWAAFTLSGLGR